MHVFFAHAGVRHALVHFFTIAAFVYCSPELPCLDINGGVSSKIGFMEIKSLVL